MSKCPDCEKGPMGQEGHPGLLTQAMTGGQVQFKCSSCGALWSRSYAPGGRFEWTAQAAGSFGGVILPRPADQRS